MGSDCLVTPTVRSQRPLADIDITPQPYPSWNAVAREKQTRLDKPLSRSHHSSTMATDVHFCTSAARHAVSHSHSHSHSHPFSHGHGHSRNRAAPHSPPQLVNDLNLLSKCSAMSTPEHPVLPPKYAPQPSRLKRVLERLRIAYYRYEVTYGLYVMSPGEKLVANTFVLVCLSLLIWALFWYFPALLYAKMGRLGWILTGKDGIEEVRNGTAGLISGSGSANVAGGTSASATALEWMKVPPRPT